MAEALELLDRALVALHAADPAALPAAVMSDALRGLERAEAKQTAARARFLSVFAGQACYEDDGQGSARAWLMWQTRVTKGAAAGAVGWVRRLSAHPAIAAVLAAGEMSTSWAKQICDWSDELPQARRGDADEILAAAAAGGANLTDLAALAREMWERSRQGQPGNDTDDGFDDRCFHLDVTYRGAGRAQGDLTPECAAALSAVLEALAKKAGPEDCRTAAQRRHDALEEACRRLIGAGLLPGRAGQATQIQVHMTLAQLLAMPGAADIVAAWLEAAADGPGWLTGPAAEALTCDAVIAPVVTGHVDWAALDKLADAFLAVHASRFSGGRESMRGCGTCACSCGTCACVCASTRPGGPDAAVAGASGQGCDGSGGHGGRGTLSPSTRKRLRRALLAMAIDALSGPGGLAAALRTGLGDAPVASPSLPLDLGAGTDTIPAHLRRAVLRRHPQCAFPGCSEPGAACQIHHLIPRSEGGPTSLNNLITLCSFHHLIVVHRWRWRIILNADGTTTAVSPDGRALDSHAPPRAVSGPPRGDVRGP